MHNKMKTGQKFKAKESFYPLYQKGDEFIIVDLTDEPNLLPIAAMKITTREIYYFNLEEI